MEVCIYFSERNLNLMPWTPRSTISSTKKACVKGFESFAMRARQIASFKVLMFVVRRVYNRKQTICEPWAEHMRLTLAGKYVEWVCFLIHRLLPLITIGLKFRRNDKEVLTYAWVFCTFCTSSSRGKRSRLWWVWWRWSYPLHHQ